MRSGKPGYRWTLGIVLFFLETFLLLKPFYFLNLGTVRVHSLEFLDHPGLAIIPARPSRLSWSTSRLRQLGLQDCHVTSFSERAAWQSDLISMFAFLFWMWVASNTCGLIQLRFSNITNEVQVGDLGAGRCQTDKRGTRDCQWVRDMDTFTTI